MWVAVYELPTCMLATEAFTGPSPSESSSLADLLGPFVFCASCHCLNTVCWGKKAATFKKNHKITCHQSDDQALIECGSCSLFKYMKLFEKSRVSLIHKEVILTLHIHDLFLWGIVWVYLGVWLCPRRVYFVVEATLVVIVPTKLEFPWLAFFFF